MSAGAAPRQDDDCLSDLALDTIVIGTWPTPEAEAHIETCERCAARLQLFRNASASAAPSVERLLAIAREAPRPQPRLGWPAIRWAFAGVASIALTAAILIGILPGDEEAVRIKGTNVRFFVQREDWVAAGVSGETYRAGDALRFAISSNEPRWFFLVGIEETGKVSAYYPFGGQRSALIEAGADRPLPGSLVLDDSQATEYYLGIFSRDPVTLAEVELAVQARFEVAPPSLASLESVLLPGVHHWVVIRKGE